MSTKNAKDTATKMPKSTFSWKDDTWVKPYFGRYKKTLFLALFLGVITIGFASALMFTAGWLIGGSAEMPYSIYFWERPFFAYVYSALANLFFSMPSASRVTIGSCA